MNSKYLISLLVCSLVVLSINASSSRRIRIARRLVERLGLKACQIRFTRLFCLASVIDDDFELVGQDEEKDNTKKFPRTTFLQHVNTGRYLTADTDSVFANDEKTQEGKFLLDRVPNGVFFTIRVPLRNSFLTANQTEVSLEKRNSTDRRQHWFFEQDRLRNRATNLGLVVSTTGLVSVSSPLDGLDSQNWKEVD